MSSGMEDLGFAPLGAHSDGTDISSATTIYTGGTTLGTRIMIQALTQNVRYTLDGTAPTATTGFQLKAGDPAVVIPLSSATTLKVIEETATADLQYQIAH